MIIFLIYIAIFVGSFFLVRLIVDQTAKGYSARKTVTFGDESAVTSNRSASVVSILTIFLLWGAFTGSSLLPRFLHAPGPFEGVATMTYTAEADDGHDHRAGASGGRRRRGARGRSGRRLGQERRLYHRRLAVRADAGRPKR